ncbi:outer membrane beta-barrel protein [Dinghuibacter silviterrae]|uniref:Outer membrane receptor protein involved in Fe transport n=1 Tax=Dinghuibacter silviterrae TaxID=1539049 RepID=A0A4R8DVR6_9BACT|nr:outer membrane beta-barrel protein [Dinghuibacter silviterrae]TDX02018.1 outer membrane receptor protein involved in Fe transport [Dinghuibacter silviterrae]
MKILLLLCLFQHTDTVRLSEVVVKATKPVYQQGPYGTIVNVGNDPLSQGSSALQALERAPGITIDHRYNSVMLNGKTGVTVLINGKVTHMSPTQLMNFLSSLNADDIERIDIMTTPPANFDAEGSAGIVNIILKKNKKKGTHGSLSLSGGYGEWPKASGSLRVEHNTGKVNLSASYSYNYDHNQTLLEAGGNEIIPEWNGLTTFVYNSNAQSIGQGQTARVGVDVQLTPRTTAGLRLSYDVWQSRSHSVNRVLYDFLPDSVFNFDGTIDGAILWKNPSASFTLERSLRKGAKLNLDIDYDDYITTGNSSVTSTFLDQHGNPYAPGDTTFAPVQRGYTGATQHVGSAKIDYSGPLGRCVQLEAGVKGDYSHSLSNAGLLSLVNGAWINRSGTTTNNFLVTEGIAAAYASFHIRFDTLTTLIAGARYEYSRTIATDTLHRILNGLFPDIFLTRKVGDDRAVVLSYTKRISRPSYDDLESSIWYNDPISVFTGNPLLRPTITHNLKLSYTSHGYALSVLASRDNYPIARYTATARAGSDLVYIAPVNLDYLEAVLLQAVLPLKPLPWWDINASASGGWTQYHASYNPIPYEKSFLSGSLNVTSVVRFPRHYLVQVSGTYNTQSFYGASENKGAATLSAVVKKEMGTRSSLLFSLTDITRVQYQGYIGSVTRDPFSTQVYVTFRPEGWWRPVAKISYVRAFGS